MKYLIFVFSGTGNTQKIADLYKNEFEMNSIHTDIVEIKGDSTAIPDDIDKYDKVGIAYPIHAFNAPLIVLNFAKKLPKVTLKPLFIIKTSGEPLKLNNISSIKLKRIMRRKGYALYNEYHYVMPYNMVFRHGDDMVYKMWHTAKALVPVDARKILQNTSQKLSYVPFGGFIAALFRIEHTAMKVNGRFFKVDYSKCVKCGRCEKVCPENNIKIVDGRIKFGGKCTCCVRCSFGCPVNAIDIALLNGWKINGAYNMENPDAVSDESHKRFCKKTYDRYFREAAEKCASEK